MERIFDADNVVMKALARLVDLVILNIITLIYSIPILTAGPALIAMNYVLQKYLTGRETYTVKMFRSSFRSNFRQGVMVWLPFLVLTILGFGDMMILHGSESKVLTALMIIITVLAGFIGVIAIYTFAQIARYEMDTKTALVNAANLTIKKLPRTLAMILFWILWIFILWYLNKAKALAIILMGVTLPGYMCALVYMSVFSKLEEDEDE